MAGWLGRVARTPILAFPLYEKREGTATVWTIKRARDGLTSECDGGE